MNTALLLSKTAALIKERRLPRGFLNLFKRYNSIVLETSNICNARCVWCWMYYSQRKDHGLMRVDDFKKFIDLNHLYLQKNKIGIIPYHRGEPLLHPHFFEMLDYGHGKGVIYSEFHTNLSVRIDRERLLSSPLPHILVNMGGTTKEVHEAVMPRTSFDLVTGNLSHLLKINHGRKPIYLKMNVTKGNYHQINQLNSFFERLGGSPENAIIGKTAFCLPAEATDEERETFFENVVCQEIDEYLKFTYDDEHNIKSKEPRCPFMIPTVKWNGKVTICCHDQLSRLDLGNAFEYPLSDILETEVYYSAEERGKRRQHYFCRECN
jgi:MoaA/NifB/PqqE/SkfB family radical SAM enzyme